MYFDAPGAGNSLNTDFDCKPLHNLRNAILAGAKGKKLGIAEEMEPYVQKPNSELKDYQEIKKQKA